MRRLLILIGVLLIAGALVWKSWTERATPTVPPPVWSDTSGVVVRGVTLWFGSSTGDSLVGEVRELPELTGVHERAAAAVTALEQGSRAGGARVIPAGTSFGGGARTEELAIASLVRTVSAFVPEAKRIRIVCGGAAFPSLGGHFPLDRPLDPEDWL